MGLAAGYFKVTSAVFEKAGQAVSHCPAEYQNNYNNKFNDVVKMRDKAISDNKTIYFERETPED